MRSLSQIGEYEQLTEFTNENAGTAEWCMAQKNGKQYFVKKFQSPVYPSMDLGLPEKKYNSRVAKFHAAIDSRKNMYHQLRENDKYGLFIIPVEVISYQYHICTIADYIIGNLRPDEICTLSEWQRIVLMRTLTLALMSVHNAGVIHSDMKPENVMIYQNENNGSCALKLIDFDGSFYESDPPEDISGDPTYSAPEIYAKQTMPAIQLDHRIDIFALGIILHYFWTGKLPYKDSDMTLGQAALKGKMIRMDSSVPVSLQEIIRQALEGNPEKRITTDEIYKKLGDLLAKYPVKIINLQENKKSEPPKKMVPKERTVSPKSSASEPKKPEVPRIISVPIVCANKYGFTVFNDKTEVECGKSKLVYAPKVSGYHIVSSTPISITADKDGKTNISVIRFTYDGDAPKEEKDTSSSGWKIFWALAIIAAILFLAIKLSSACTLQNCDQSSAFSYIQTGINADEVNGCVL